MDYWAKVYELRTRKIRRVLMKIFILLFLCVAGCNSFNKSREPANSRFFVGITPDKLSLTYALCEEVFSANDKIDRCKKWADQNQNLNIFDLANNLCQTDVLVTRQYSCFKKAASGIQVNPSFKDGVTRCDDRLLIQNRVGCFLDLFRLHSQEVHRDEGLSEDRQVPR
jgi:hypothetical protein